MDKYNLEFYNLKDKYNDKLSYFNSKKQKFKISMKLIESIKADQTERNELFSLANLKIENYLFEDNMNQLLTFISSSLIDIDDIIDYYKTTKNNMEDYDLNLSIYIQIFDHVQYFNEDYTNDYKVAYVEGLIRLAISTEILNRTQQELSKLIKNEARKGKSSIKTDEKGFIDFDSEIKRREEELTKLKENNDEKAKKTKDTKVMVRTNSLKEIKDKIEPLYRQVNILKDFQNCFIAEDINNEDHDHEFKENNQITNRGCTDNVNFTQINDNSSYKDINRIESFPVPNQNRFDSPNNSFFKVEDILNTDTNTYQNTNLTKDLPEEIKEIIDSYDNTIETIHNNVKLLHLNIYQAFLSLDNSYDLNRFMDLFKEIKEIKIDDSFLKKSKELLSIEGFSSLKVTFERLYNEYLQISSQSEKNFEKIKKLKNDSKELLYKIEPLFIKIIEENLNISLEKTDEILKNINENDRNFIALTGNSGVGKTTLLLYLYGVPFKLEDNQIIPKLENHKFLEDFEISSDPNSKTRNVNIPKNPINSYLKSPINELDKWFVIDTAGFLETASRNIELVNNFSILNLLKKSKKVSFVYVMNLHDERFLKIDEDIRITKSLLNKCELSSINKINFLLRTDPNKRKILKDNLYKFLNKVDSKHQSNYITKEVLVNLYQKFEGINIDLTDDKIKDDILSKITMNTINDPSSFFKLPLSSDSTRYINEYLSNVENSINHCIDYFEYDLALWYFKQYIKFTGIFNEYGSNYKKFYDVKKKEFNQQSESVYNKISELLDKENIKNGELEEIYKKYEIFNRDNFKSMETFFYGGFRKICDKILVKFIDIVNTMEAGIKINNVNQISQEIINKANRNFKNLQNIAKYDASMNVKFQIHESIQNTINEQRKYFKSELEVKIEDIKNIISKEYFKKSEDINKEIENTLNFLAVSNSLDIILIEEKHDLKLKLMKALSVFLENLKVYFTDIVVRINENKEEISNIDLVLKKLIDNQKFLPINKYVDAFHDDLNKILLEQYRKEIEDLKKDFYNKERVINVNNKKKKENFENLKIISNLTLLKFISPTVEKVSQELKEEVNQFTNHLKDYIESKHLHEWDIDDIKNKITRFKAYKWIENIDLQSNIDAEFITKIEHDLCNKLSESYDKELSKFDFLNNSEEAYTHFKTCLSKLNKFTSYDSEELRKKSEEIIKKLKTSFSEKFVDKIVKFDPCANIKIYTNYFNKVKAYEESFFSDLLKINDNEFLKDFQIKKYIEDLEKKYKHLLSVMNNYLEYFKNKNDNIYTDSLENIERLYGKYKQFSANYKVFCDGDDNEKITINDEEIRKQYLRIYKQIHEIVDKEELDRKVIHVLSDKLEKLKDLDIFSDCNEKLFDKLYEKNLKRLNTFNDTCMNKLKSLLEEPYNSDAINSIQEMYKKIEGSTKKGCNEIIKERFEKISKGIKNSFNEFLSESKKHLDEDAFVYSTYDYSILLNLLIEKKTIIELFEKLNMNNQLQNLDLFNELNIGLNCITNKIEDKFKKSTNLDNERYYIGKLEELLKQIDNLGENNETLKKMKKVVQDLFEKINSQSKNEIINILEKNEIISILKDIPTLNRVKFIQERDKNYIEDEGVKNHTAFLLESLKKYILSNNNITDDIN